MNEQGKFILAYVNSDGLSFTEAMELAIERDQAAAAALKESAETVLHLEEAAAVCNEVLDVHFEKIS